MKKFTFAVIIYFISNSLSAAPGDTTWVNAYTNDFHNWATVNYASVTFPDTTQHFEKILMKYTIGCPTAGCDPWDRLGWVRLYTDTATGAGYEIGRIITPYNIVGGGYPGTCTFWLDVTDYMPLLHDTQILGHYIESWIGGQRGWLSTISFAFIEGEAYYKPYKVINLWQDHYIVYGDTADPFENYLQPIRFFADPNAVKVKGKVITTGHGQGNSHNAAEFSVKYHQLIVNDDTLSHNLWRSDCSGNPCSPQGGTWPYARAGWCPGASVNPWDLDITLLVTLGDSNTVNYDIEPYVNLCRPTNPNCTTGVTCADCNYNNNGHTEPNYNIESQIILYRLNPAIGINDPGTIAPALFTLQQNYPNPFNPVTRIKFTLQKYSHVTIKVFAGNGTEIAVLINEDMKNGEYEVEFDGKNLSSGVYFYQMEAGDFKETRKMLLIK
ncbi:MAG: T9SS type A sorting domain-containing protein [Ignavibacteria bacterium]|nr:T9SS type A sorting domain-containing protein [Ignavibacteria bacterium]